MKFRTSWDQGWAGEKARVIKDLLQRHWHLDSVGLGNCRAAQAIRRELNEQLFIQSAALANANFNSNEPRDRSGEWTTGGAGGAKATGPAPTQPVKPDESSRLTLAAAQVQTVDDAIKSVVEHATRNPFLHQLLQRALRVLTTFEPHSAGLQELSGLSKAIVADAAAEMMHAPEYGGNIRAFLLGKEMPVDQALRESAQEQKFRGETPNATVAGKLAENLAEALPMIAAMRGLPVGVQKILTTVFTAKMLKDAPGIAKQLIAEFRKPASQQDANKIDSLVADAIETLGFTVLGMLGSGESSKGEPAENPEGAGESKPSEPAALPKPDDTPDNGAVYARPKRAATGGGGGDTPGKRGLRSGEKAKAPNEEEIATQPYGGSGGGHHTVAKSALRGDPLYNFRKALAISNDELARLGAKHRLISVAQRRLYVAFRKTGQKLDWDSIEKIETEALMRGGVKSETAAKAVVKRAITALKTDGVKPRRIPWGD